MIENIEIFKWFVAIPSALIATITIPWVIRKYYLECKKLHLEIILLQEKLGEKINKTTIPGPIFSWFSRYWAIPCYGSLAVLMPIGFVIKSGWVTLIGFSISLICFVAGSAVEERYREIKREFDNNS